MPAGEETLTRSSPERLTRLVEADRYINTALALDDLLHRVVRSGCDVLRARHAVLGVLGSDGSLEHVVSWTMSAPQGVAAVTPAQLEDRRLLRALLEAAEPVRVPSVGGDPRLRQLPPHHHEASPLLGVPVHSAGGVSGALYVTDPTGTPEFDEEDEMLARSLACTAGIAIEKARLYAESQRRQAWLRASTEVGQLLLSGDRDSRRVLGVIVDRMRDLAQADVVSLVLPDPKDPAVLEVALASGERSEELVGLRYGVEHAVAWQAMQQEHGVLVGTDGGELDVYLHQRSIVPVTQAMALPLKGTQAPFGAMVLARIRQEPFTTAELEMAEGFASQVTLALELADNRTDRLRLVMLEDRARIARDLHDHIVQRLFAAGLTLQGLTTMITNPTIRGKLLKTIDNLDETIRRLRTSIFDLQSEVDAATVSPRRRITQVVDELATALGFAPQVRLSGPLDTVLDESTAVEAEAVLRESLTNVAKHAHASMVSVDVVVAGTRLTLRVSDDGQGLAAAAKRRSGLDNLRHRAEQRGGTFTLDRSALGGLELTWTISVR